MFPDPIPFRRIGDDGVWHLGGATIQVRSIFVAAAALALAALGVRLLQRTRFGRALEAIAQDFDAAVIVGLPVSLLVGLAFALAGVGASLAAVLAAPSTAFDVDAAARYGLYGLVAAVVAWFDARQALLAGIALGLIQSTVTSAHWGGGPALRDVIPLALGLAVLAWRFRHARGGRMSGFAPFGEGLRDARRHWTLRTTLTTAASWSRHSFRS